MIFWDTLDIHLAKTCHAFFKVRNLYNVSLVNNATAREEEEEEEEELIPLQPTASSFLFWASCRRRLNSSPQTSCYCSPALASRLLPGLFHAAF
mmetsp:Transcript_3135/g.3894  ORF Transcript_3135/g.3894 Transcript_3135/m.3894 type:complete len:94 (-) Transcript_3135:387-668(-)